MKKLLYLFFIFLPVTFSYAVSYKVMILDLNNLTRNPNFDYLSTSLPKSLATTLKRNSQFQIMDSELVNQKLKKEKINKANMEYKQLLKIGDDLKANIVIQGNYILIGETIQINLEAIDIGMRKIKIAESVNGEAGTEIFELVDDIVNKMSDRMTKELPSPQEEEQIVKEKMNVETVYLSESRKDQWFFTQFGLVANSSQFDYNNQIIKNNSTVPVIGLGYGYKFIRFYLRGNPPIFLREEEEQRNSIKLGSNIDLNFQLELLKRKFFIDLSLYFIEGNIHYKVENKFSEGFDFRAPNLLLGGTYTLLPKLFISLGLSYPLNASFIRWMDNNKINIAAERRLGIQTGIKWIFLGETGIQLLYKYFSSKSQKDLPSDINNFKPEIIHHTFMLALCYDVDF